MATVKDKRPINIILLGDPAAGKATQSNLLVKKYKLFDLDMGKELRKITSKRVRDKYRLAQTIDKGKLAQTGIVRDIMYEKIHQQPKSKGIIFDGTPKMIGEARLLSQWLKDLNRRDPVVLYLSLPVSESAKRMGTRVEYFYGKFSKRADDSDKALQNRIKYYRKNIKEVIKFFKTKYVFKKIDSGGSIQEIHKRILTEIERFNK